jgi:hypothetical protein
VVQSTQLSNTTAVQDAKNQYTSYSAYGTHTACACGGLKHCNAGASYCAVVILDLLQRFTECCAAINANPFPHLQLKRHLSNIN